jgi:cytochrome P450
MTETAVPSDISTNLVSPWAYAAQTDLMAGFRWLRRYNRIGRVEAEGFDPFWAVTTYADIVDISRRQDLFSNGDRSTTLVPRTSDDFARSFTGGSPHLVRTLLQMDGVDHERHRRITQPRFTRQSVERLEARIRQLARDAVDRMAEHGDSCDFVHVALRFPLQITMEMLGIPAEDEWLLLDLLQASRDPWRHAKRLIDALSAFENYFLPLMNERRKHPRDDLTSIVSVAEIDGKPIGQSEAISYYILLATAGFHTAAAAISGGVWALCENAELFHNVPDRSLREATTSASGALMSEKLQGAS